MYYDTAGILPYRITLHKKVEFFLIHHGHPSSKGKDLGMWSIPKGEIEDGENPLDAAKREFKEETDQEAQEEFLQLTPILRRKNCTMYAWTCMIDINPEAIKSKIIECEWPPKSGKMKKYLEVDKAGWFPYEEAKQKINPKQVKFIEELMDKLSLKS